MMTHAMSSIKLLFISLSLNIIGNIQSNVGTQVNKIYNIHVVVFELLMQKCYILYLKSRMQVKYATYLT